MNRKIADLIWFALQCAKQDRLSLSECYEENSPERKEILRDHKAFESLQLKLFGTTKSRLDIEMERAHRIDIYDLLASNLSLEDFLQREIPARKGKRRATR